MRVGNPMLETKQTATEISYNEHAILKMDAAFRARMHAAMAVGREYAPIGIGTEPGLGVANALRLPICKMEKISRTGT